MVELRNLWVLYDHQPVLEDVTLDIRENTFVGVLGPNGAGKSTLLKVILGLIPPTRGEVRVFGRDPRQARRRGDLIGYLPQRPLTNPRFPVSVLDVVLMGAYGRIGLGRRPSRQEREAALAHLARLGIPHLADRPIGEISGGEQQRVFIARALAVNPRLLVMDEPTISLDACAQDEVYDLINQLKNELKLTVILVSHDIGAVATHVDDIVCLNRRVHVHAPPPIGRLALESTFGCAVEYLFHGEIPHRVVRSRDD
ncbi:MAG: metal ABC transporter ATP-binding protein [Desulfobaccales bacterium]